MASQDNGASETNAVDEIVAKPGFIDRLEAILMALILIGIVLVAQQWSVMVYRVGLSILVCATLVQIAVGNVPRDLSVVRSLLRIVILLCVVALMFGIGILLAPIFAQIGR
ncbi:hypothetical protein SAMN05880582_11056 [Rhizobium sp. RU20A]|uniref:hypothetical protein n=1 Tax=Rhizobium sp. RU20A TaxID=1907412 RepID=UPI0009564728|nr:hypothetical protein [Rhizobium sp. RU20A]SIR32681.1 hypothetical protein SAMN05880582_11056 [Rhizobium sp. RU20A]